jgi:hypothetical protein
VLSETSALDTTPFSPVALGLPPATWNHAIMLPESVPTFVLCLSDGILGLQTVEIGSEFIILLGLFGSPRILTMVTSRGLRRSGCLSKIRLQETYTEFWWQIYWEMVTSEIDKEMSSTGAKLSEMECVRMGNTWNTIRIMSSGQHNINKRKIVTKYTRKKTICMCVCDSPNYPLLNWPSCGWSK